MPNDPWQELVLDFLGPFPSGEYLLVIVDYYSQYLVVKIMKTITTEKLIAAMEETIDMFGIPYSVTSDNGPQLVSKELKSYLRHLNTGKLHRSGHRQTGRMGDRIELF